MKEARPQTRDAEERKDVSEVFGGRVIKTGPSGGVGVGKVLGWPPGGSVVCKARPTFGSQAAVSVGGF